MNTTAPTSDLATTSDAELVIVACRVAWQAAGFQPVCRDWRSAAKYVSGDQGSSLGIRYVAVIEQRHLIECVFDTFSDLICASADLERLLCKQWQVQVLVPLARLGEAHRSLRGLPLKLQGYWLDLGQVRFGAEETP